MRRLPQDVSERIRRYLARLKKDDELSALLSLLNSSGEAFLFGGAVRDAAFGVSSQVVDLDIVVAGHINVDAISRRFGEVRTTKLGGKRLQLGAYEVDFWELNDSFTLRSYPRSEVNMMRLLRNVCFSTDAVAIATSRFKAIVDPLFIDSYQQKLLEFVVPPASLDPKVVVRIARLVVKHELEMSIAVASYFTEGVEKFGRASIVHAEGSWGRHALLNDLRLEGVRAELDFAIRRASEAQRL